jgi:hypothetical protein
MIDAFEAQAVANILHIIAKTRYIPCDQSLVPKLEGRATRCGRMRRWGGCPGQ